MSQFNHSSHYSDDIQTAVFADCLANSKKIFELIDTVFPVDSCLHYEVLPLSLEGSSLTLGMLDPNNEESLKFINSIAKVFKYDLILKLIDGQTLQIILASYPQHSEQPKRQNKSSDQNKTVIEEAFDPKQFSVSNGSSRRKVADSAPTIISQSIESPSAKKDNTPLDLPGLPADLDFLRDLDLSPQSNSNSKPSRAEIDQSGTLYEIPPEFLNQQKSHNSDSQKTVIGGNPAELLAESALPNESKMALVEEQISNLIAEVSNQLVESDISESVNFLTELNPNLSWHKLLEQAFEYGSEQIDLTRHSDRGSITAIKHKSTHSSIEQVPLPIFCSLIDEIKRMAKIPLDLSNHSKKVVLERFYQEERILLRLEFTVQDEQELVIVQIFRGKNLIAYEQQQMDKVSEQALYLAKQLEKTLRRIQACFDSAKFTSLKELQMVQSRINHQLRLLDK